MAIHPTAIVDSDAQIDPTADIGPYAVIEGHVRIGPGTVVEPFAHISGFTEIGARCRIHTHAVVGGSPQDRAFQGHESYCRIGDDTMIREGVTVHRGTQPGSATVIGSRCLIMCNAHVGHNCVLADDVTLVNGSLLGGHVHVGRRAFISGNAAVHQFCRIGELAMIGGLTKVVQDIPPFCMADDDGSCVGLNNVGLKRAGFTAADRADVREAFGVLYRMHGTLAEKIQQIAATVRTDAGRRFLEFVQAPSKRGLADARLKPRAHIGPAILPGENERAAA